MPQRRERMAYYVRESDESLASSVTIESQAKACIEYGEKQKYILELQHQYAEAVSAYEVPYMERHVLLAMLDAAKRKEFDVLVVSEICAIARRQVEVLVIYNMLQKYGVRLETVKEKFGDDAMSKAILSLRAMFVEIEKEQITLRMERGKADRVAIGQAPNGATPFYTHILVDTDREVKGRYELNHEIVFIDESGKQWSRIDVMLLICNLLSHGGSLNRTAKTLNAMGIPSAKGKHWLPETIRRMVSNPILYGEVYANRYKQIDKRRSKNGKQVSVEIMRPREEWIRLPDAPAVISKETFDRIQSQIQTNKAESIRNNKQKDVGLLRAGYIFCGICGNVMHIAPPSKAERGYIHRYYCRRDAGGKLGIAYNHRTQISVKLIETEAKRKIVETLLHPELVRAKVESIRNALKPTYDTTDIEETIAGISKSIQNLYKLAEYATTDDTIAELAERMNNLETQKRKAEKLLYDIADDREERLELEVELTRFEKWVDEVRPFLTDPTYLETASYDELRVAVKILGLRVTVFPSTGEWEYRYKIDVTVPEIMKKLSVAMQS